MLVQGNIWFSLELIRAMSRKCPLFDHIMSTFCPICQQYCISAPLFYNHRHAEIGPPVECVLRRAVLYYLHSINEQFGTNCQCAKSVNRKHIIHFLYFSNRTVDYSHNAKIHHILCKIVVIGSEV